VIMDDEGIVREMRERGRVPDVLEFDASYLPFPIQESKGECPRLPKMIVLMDARSRVVLCQHMADKGEPIESTVLGMLHGFVMHYGVPAEVRVRDRRGAGLIGDMCGKIGTRVNLSRGVPGIDRLYKRLLRDMR